MAEAHLAKLMSLDFEMNITGTCNIEEMLRGGEPVNGLACGFCSTRIFRAPMGGLVTK